MEEPVFFGITDYVIMGLMLVLSLGIGIYFAVAGRGQRTQEDYLLGGRNLAVAPVCLSLFATYNSAVSLLGIPAEIYSHGTMMIYLIATVPIANILCLFTLLPLVYPLRVTSIFEYLQLRFESKGVRLLGATLGIFQNVAYMTIALLSPALALQTAVGMPLWMSLIGVGFVGTLYTAIGGIKSVVWTDAFQTVIIFGGIIATVIKGCLDVGGFTYVWTRTEEKGRLIFDDVDPDPRARHTVMGCLTGGTFLWMSVYFGQSFFQRLCSTSSANDARKVILYVAPLNLFYGIILLFTGMTLMVYFDVIGCDPLAAGYIDNPNQLMPYFVIRTFGFIPGLSGLYISTIFSGALSTLSSGINALSANTVEDLLQPVLRNFQDSTVTAFSKVLVFIYGCAIICLAYFAKEVKGPITQASSIALGGIGGPVFGMFLLAATFPQANKVGASTGCLLGIISSVAINVAKMVYGTVTPPLAPGPTDTCQIPGIAAAPGGNETFFGGIKTQTEETTVVTGLLDFSTETISTNKNIVPLERDFHLYDISYIWTPVLGTLVCMVTGLIVSWIYELATGSKKRPKPEYLFPFMRKVWYKNERGMNDGGGDKELRESFIRSHKV